jgi:protocatechuate 3,4-dioxygenase beta subunit
MPLEPSMNRPIARRRLQLAAAAAALLALPALHLGARAQGARLRPTPAQTEGPFYPVALPADNDADLLANGSLRYAHGRPAWVEGTLSDVDGRPLPGGVVEIWQCDQEGRYHHPGDGDRADRAFQGFGRVVADREGRWRFRTIRPVAYGGRAPHIHAKVKLGARELLTTQFYVEGDPGNARDFLWNRLSADDRRAVTASFAVAADGHLSAKFAVVVAA